MTSDRDLLAAYARRDESAFDRFYERHVDAVYAHVFRGVRDDSLAQEIVQDVFFLAALKWRSIAYRDGSARTWLLGSAQNFIRNKLRKSRHSLREVGLLESAPTIPDMNDLDERLDNEATLVEVQRTIESMDELDRRIYRYTIVDGRTAVATATELGMSEGSVRKRVQRIRSRLRAAVGDT